MSANEQQKTKRNYVIFNNENSFSKTTPESREAAAMILSATAGRDAYFAMPITQRTRAIAEISRELSKGENLIVKDFAETQFSTGRLPTTEECRNFVANVRDQLLANEEISGEMKHAIVETRKAAEVARATYEKKNKYSQQHIADGQLLKEFLGVNDLTSIKQYCENTHGAEQYDPLLHTATRSLRHGYVSADALKALGINDEQIESITAKVDAKLNEHAPAVANAITR